MRMLDDLPWDELRERPKWLVGFSDVTALHAMAWSQGVASVHGPNVTGLGVDASPARAGGVAGGARAPGAPRTWPGLRVAARGGARRGVLVGGNLSLLYAMAAAGQLVTCPEERSWPSRT